jgi:hypothetical protein
MAQITLEEMKTVADVLLAHIGPGLPPKALANVLDSMIWSLDAEVVTPLQEAWLMSGDRARVEVALEMDEVLPFVDGAMMVAVLDRVAEQWPDLSSKCERLKASRERVESGAWRRVEPPAAKLTVDEMRVVADLVLAHRALGLGPKAFAEVFDSLSRVLDDNGAAIARLCEEWLVSDNRERVEVALEVGEVDPFDDPSLMFVVLDRISEKWPRLAAKCVGLKTSRARRRPSVR